MLPIKFDRVPEIKLIACDMDGTLLDDDQEIHDDFWPLVDQLHSLGIIFCAASGRQYFNLLERFHHIADKVIFIAENGTYVVQGGVELSSNCIARETAHELIKVSRTLKSRGINAGAVLSGKRSAYIERKDEAFLAQVTKYYHRLKLVDDLMTIKDDFLKVSLFDFESAEQMAAPEFTSFQSSCQVVLSGHHWLDIMAQGVNKGSGVRQVQNILNIGMGQTMAFGDFLNDIEMMDEADYSFAMENAHPQLKKRAKFIAPGNTENGVVRTIKSVLRIC